jgi:NAD(P)-dependent dehydrogenase (short-subunit alcohol dehydrogenase family)
VLRAMAKNGEGHIVNVGSVVGRRGRGGLASYGASKAAMMAMTDSLREEAQRSGIKVSLVSPDRVATAMQEGAASGRMLPPSDVAEAVAFLLRLSPSGVVHELTLHVMGD